MSSPPTSYASLPFTQIRLSHHPASSPMPTPIIVLTLYRPANNNAFTSVMMKEIVTAYELFETDTRVKCVVLTGHGRMFCAGADLELGFRNGRDAAGEGEGERGHRDGGGRVSLAIHNSRVPTIAALNGSAVGVGITMTLPTAIRLCSSSAKIGFPFSRRGLAMEAASAFFLPRLIGYSKALHLVTIGAVYKATDPLLRELFSEVLESERVLPRALELAEDVVANTSSVSAKVMRDMIWRGPGSVEEMHLLDSRILWGMFGSRDNEEGIASFMEKRKPEFKGTMEEDTPSVYPWWTPVNVSTPTAKKGEVDKGGKGGKAKL